MNKQKKNESIYKRMILLFLLITGVGGVLIFASNPITSVNQIILQVTLVDVDPTAVSGEHPRSPIQPPNIYLNSHVLDMSDVSFDTTLQIIDENNEVVYTTFVTQGTESVSLPNSFSGYYKLQLLWGNWCFYGRIEL